MNLINQICLGIAISLVCLSCQPKEEVERTLTAEEYTIAENFYHEMQLFAEGFLSEDTLFNKTAAAQSISCDAEITIIQDSTKEGSGKVIMDFDAGQGVCDDGKERSGQLQFEFTERFVSPEARLIITPINYMVNSYSIEGAMTLTYLEPDSLGSKHYGVSIIESKIKNDILDVTFFWACNYEKLQTSGQSTATIQDDVIQVSGTATGTSSNGNRYTATITTPLRYEFCSFITSGIIDVTRSGGADFTIDYGVGSCDNRASMIINGNGYPFTLR